MTTTLARPVRLGPLGGEHVAVSRSGFHWLHEDGHICRPNEVIAYCNVSVQVAAALKRSAASFAEERTFQIALATRTGGRLRIPTGNSFGGYLDVLGVHVWDAEEVIAHIEPVTGEKPTPTEPLDHGSDTARLLLLAGRRMGWAVDVDTGLVPGWNSRARAWWGDGGAEETQTLLCLGICDASGVVRGDQSGFVEMFEAAQFPAQMVHISEHPIAPCATVLVEQFLRTPAQLDAISADIKRTLSQGAATPEDWFFFGALLSQLGHSPMRESYELLTARGLEKRTPADAILMSLSAEPLSILRHRNLRYHLNILDHNQRAAGPVGRAWLASAFEQVPRSLDQIRRDYIRLFETVGAATGARFLIINRMSTSGREDISSYAPFDAPMGQTLSSISAKEMNLMLDDLAGEYDVSVVDVDAVASEIGGREHLPDGIHQSGLMQSLVRRDILNILAEGASRQQNR